MHTVASAIIGAQKTHARKAADFYPTPVDASQVLLDQLQLAAGTSVWEPACGDGAMAQVLEANALQVTATDLRIDSGYGQGGVDFLAADSIPCDWIITNPPFNVAPEFIEKALSITPNVAMLLKSQFWHARRRIELFERLPPALILALTWRPSFLEAERGSSPLMDVMWVVWMDGDTSSTYRPVRRPAAKQYDFMLLKYDLDALLGGQLPLDDLDSLLG